MLLLHPALQAIFTALSLYTLYLGIQRARSLHLGQRVRFPRKRHIRLGKIVVVGILIGAVVGLTMTRITWGRSFMTMGHGTGGVITLILFLAGGILGLVLEQKPGKRTVLPAVHGVLNTVGVGFALNQIRTGIEVYQTFLSGL